MSFYGSLNATEDDFIGLQCENMLSIPEHRSGWNYVKDLCVRYVHRPNGYYFVDFVESIWGWKKKSSSDAETKDVFFENESYDVPRDQVKFYRNKEYVYLPSIHTVVYWNGLEWVRSETVTSEELERASPFGVIEEPWVGIVHNPTQMPEWFDFVSSPQEIVKCVDFQKSLRYCRGLIVFSEYLKKELLKMGGWPCEIHVLLHPTEPCATRWCLPGPNLLCWKPNKSHKRRLVQVGYWLRRLSSIWDTRVPKHWTKHWVNRAEHGFRCLESELFHEHLIRSIVQSKDAVQVHQLSDEDYDQFLSRSILFIDLYDSSCNNAILEAIVRHVPIVTRRLPATIEYLGDTYPLFFDHVDEIHDMLLDDARIHAAHTQLVRLEESGRFYGEHFVHALKRLPFLNKKALKPDYVLALGSQGWIPSDIPNRAVSPFENLTIDYASLCHLLDNDLNGLTDPYHLYVNEDGQVAHREYHLVFSQETDTAEKLLDFTRNDYAKLIRLYTQRVHNFHTVMWSHKTCLVLFHSEYPRKLVDVLRTKYPRARFKLITINLIEDSARYLDQPTNVDHPDVAFYTIKRTGDHQKIIREHLSK